MLYLSSQILLPRWNTITWPFESIETPVTCPNLDFSNADKLGQLETTCSSENLVIVYHPFCMNTLFPFGASSYADQENKNDEN